MALDTRQKRMAAVNVAAPWRGALVDASETSFSSGNRMAAAYMAVATAAAVVTAVRDIIGCGVVPFPR